MGEKVGDIGPQAEIGAYEVRVRSVEKEADKRTPGEYYRRWTFVTREGHEFKATSSIMLGPKSKAYKWIKAIVGTDPTGLDFPDAVIDKPCLLHIDHDEDGYAYVADVYPRVVAQNAPLPTPAAVAFEGTSEGAMAPVPTSVGEDRIVMDNDGPIPFS